jgi:uncharacterized protein YceK
MKRDMKHCYLAKLWPVGLVMLACSGCGTVVAVADAAASTAVTVASTVVKTGVKITGAVVDAVIPDKK